MLCEVGRTCGGDREDAVGVDVKLDLNLGDPPRGRGDAVQSEVAEGLVVAHKLTLACSGNKHTHLINTR